MVHFHAHLSNKKRLQILPLDPKSEFADELVVAVTAQKLGVPIVVIPAVPEWKIQTHPHPDLHAHLSIDSNDAIYLGCLHVHKI